MKIYELFYDHTFLSNFSCKKRGEVRIFELSLSVQMYFTAICSSFVLCVPRVIHVCFYPWRNITSTLLNLKLIQGHLEILQLFFYNFYSREVSVYLVKPLTQQEKHRSFSEFVGRNHCKSSSEKLNTSMQKNFFKDSNAHFSAPGFFRGVKMLEFYWEII